MPWRRYVIRILLAFIVILLLFWGFRPQPLLVDTEKVSRGAMARTIEEEGRTRVMHVYRISAPVPGEVRRLELQVGDAVAAGQVVAQIAAQASAILDVRSINQAEARVAAAASGVVSLHAPVAGQVLRRFFESARVVAAGEPILEIGDPAQLEVEIDVLSSDAVRIEPGMRVLFERWGEAELLQGRVRRVEPGGFTKISALGVEEQRVWVIADFTLPPTVARARLGDGYRVNARFILWESEDTVRVPLSALFRRNEHWAVFVVEAGRAHLRRVDLGERGGRFAQALGGLQVGDEVIVHPGRDLEEDLRVRPREGRY